jgi:hypothetical protein
MSASWNPSWWIQSRGYHTHDPHRTGILPQAIGTATENARIIGRSHSSKWTEATGHQIQGGVTAGYQHHWTPDHLVFKGTV